MSRDMRTEANEKGELENSTLLAPKTASGAVSPSPKRQTILYPTGTAHKKVPNFPLGPHKVRGLLFLRGIAGSVRLFSLYYSLSYLDVSDATVITFLVPTLTAFIAWVTLREPFTVNKALAAYLTIYIIKKRAYSLISINYFTILATISSFLIIIIYPNLQFKIPKSLAEWAVLLSIGKKAPLELKKVPNKERNAGLNKDRTKEA
ncbi:hypothetical protein HYE67_007868 [Fusarium culmorum]|uniref:EamA domain-containing protein n=1 Tax=Fusarium culmorum TaxID=5516 RepID=A0A2T4GER5_FUSCU|nr:hypothetical protein FCULG_00012920 [Fusarium culmorum]QPC65637.1 hypothetical protein HYE67_007868 [Fusarium culmorum]